MDFWGLGFKSIKELESEHGILASSRNEKYGCIFGRDSLITALLLMQAHQRKSEPYFLTLVAKILRSLTLLQGKKINLESGEEPGKMIHEWRPTGHEHLTMMRDVPWYLYPDNVMRNYDTVDATPLFLMTAHEYYRLTKDDALIRQIEPSIKAALEWILTYGDSNGDGLIDYQFHPDRKYGGLRTQSWMDSSESVFFEHGERLPRYPIAPLEVQAYTFAALRSWSAYFIENDSILSSKLSARAQDLKDRFNQQFVIRKGHATTLAFAIDGSGERLTSARSSMGHVLWATVKKADGSHESILHDAYIPSVAHRLMSKDLFVARAGVRTLSNRSSQFDPVSYHNGSIWPHDTAILAYGLEQFGYMDNSKRVRDGMKYAYSHFATPIELFGFSRGKYHEYKRRDGVLAACRIQAWSAAALLSIE